MSPLVSLFAAVALVPAMAGPINSADENLLRLGLCGGGILTIPVRGEPANLPEKAPCAKGCHSGSTRKRTDRAQ